MLIVHPSALVCSMSCAYFFYTIVKELRRNRSRILLAQRTNSLAAMEPAQKRQRVAATTMQRVGLLPKELQGRILMLAIETPTAAVVKAAIGEAHGEPRWWATLLGHDKGHQHYLNRHTHCHRLWARVLEERNGSLAWVWSQSNVFVNQTGRAHMRGAWPGLENEMSVRRRVGGDSPADMFVAANGLGRELHMDMPPSHFSTPVPLGTFTDTCGYAVLNEPVDGTIRLHWGDHATRCSEALNRLYFARQRPRNGTQLESLRHISAFVEHARLELDIVNEIFREIVMYNESLRELLR